MSKLLASTSSGALLAGASPEPTDTDYVVLQIAYDCFNLEDRDRHELQWRPEATLADYLSGLPEDCEWIIYINGTEVTLEENGNDHLCQLDELALILVPQGGSGIKSIMRIALMAVSVVVAFIPGMQWWAAAGIALASGLVSTFLLTPKPPKPGKDEDKSYGIDGPKNSATENIPYPVVYGEFRMAGNLSDCYTVNVGDDQYLYLRAVLNDGEIESVSDIELNEQPIENFKDVQYRVHKGTLTEPVNDWFPSSIVQVNKGITLGTAWTTHQTSGDVDRARFDFVFPEGLANVNLKKGTKDSFSVELAFEYRLLGDTTWKPLPLTTPSSGGSTGSTSGGYGTTVRADGSLLSVHTRAEILSARTTAATVKATDVNTGQVYDLGSMSPTEEELQGQTFDAANDGTLAGPTDATPYINRLFHAELPESTYDVSVTGGEIVSALSSGGTTGAPSNPGGIVKFTDRRAKPIRKSVESASLPHGTYEFRVRRTAAEDEAEDHLDTVILSDVAEIENTPVALRGTANLSIRIRLSEQLNAIPNATAKVKGSLCRRYDDQGNVIDQVWTANNAWHALDALLGEERGAGMNPNRIDWPRWVEYAQWCEDNGIQFNGVFADTGNIGDATRQILRIGQAAVVPFGRKFSVAVDRERDPVHAFTNASIIKGSFQMSYLSMADRANEYEFTYYDKTDRNKAKTIRYVDPKAVTFNEIPRPAQVTLTGVDNIDQAKKEMWKAIYQNRLLIRHAEFESWLDSINMTLGEVALLQHDMMEWANSGRIKAGATASHVTLDQNVTLESGKSYSLLIHHSALLRGSTTVSSVVGSTLLVNKPSGANFTTDQLNSKRLVVGGEDYEIASITNGATYHTIKLTTVPTAASVGATVELWDTDVLEERPVSTAGPVTTDTLDVGTPFSVAPSEFSNFVFGEVTSVRKPYTLLSVSGNGLEKRKLSFIEYHAGVYAEPEVDIPIPVTAVSDRPVSHVRAITFSYDTIVEANRSMVPVTLKWRSGHILNYGGADVFVSVNGEAPVSAGAAVDASHYTVTCRPGDLVEFTVVAFNKRGDRAALPTAPTIRGTIACQFATLDPPTDLTTNDVAFEVDGKIAVNWTNPADMTGVQNFEVEYKRAPDSVWTSVGYYNAGPVEISGLPTGNYDVRVRSSSVTSTSVWVEGEFAIAIAPGSLMDNWNSRNDRNGAPIPAPTLPATGVVDHTLNNDGSANISFEWLWDGDETTIDGFQVDIDDTPPA